MAKGDWVSVTYAVGDSSQEVLVTAEANGRKLEIDSNNKWLTVRELTRGGTEVKKATFKMDAVLSYISNFREE